MILILIPREKHAICPPRGWKVLFGRKKKKKNEKNRLNVYAQRDILLIFMTKRMAFNSGEFIVKVY